jgi:hypothetical protein
VSKLRSELTEWEVRERTGISSASALRRYCVWAAVKRYRDDNDNDNLRDRNSDNENQNPAPNGADEAKATVSISKTEWDSKINNKGAFFALDSNKIIKKS